MNLNLIFTSLFLQLNRKFDKAYSIEFELKSDTHKFDKIRDYSLRLSKFNNPFFDVQGKDEKLHIKIFRPKNNFFNPTTDTYNFIFKLEEIIKDYSIGISIISRGIFFPFELGNLKFEYEISDSEFGRMIPEFKSSYYQPIRYTNKGKVLFKKRKIHLYHLIFPIVWTYFRDKKKWEQIHYFYSKALILLSQKDIKNIFYDEVFMLYYKIIENLSTLDFLLLRKLGNEKKEITSVIKSNITDVYLHKEIENIYILRSKILAHSQTSIHELATFKNVYDVKKIVDLLIIKKNIN